MDETVEQYMIWTHDDYKWHEIRKAKTRIERIPNEPDRLWLEGQALADTSSSHLYSAEAKPTSYSPEIEWARFKAEQCRRAYMDYSMLGMVEEAAKASADADAYLHNIQVEVDRMVAWTTRRRKVKYPEKKPNFQTKGAYFLRYETSKPLSSVEQHEADYDNGVDQ